MKPAPKLARGELLVRFFHTITQVEIDLFEKKYHISRNGHQRPRWKSGSPFETYNGLRGVLEVPKGKEEYYFRKFRRDWLVAYVDRPPYEHHFSRRSR